MPIEHLTSITSCAHVCQPHQQGIISQASLEKAAALRRVHGAAFVLVSGARTSTVLQRLPFLPAADAIIAENGVAAERGAGTDRGCRLLGGATLTFSHTACRWPGVAAHNCRWPHLVP